MTCPKCGGLLLPDQDPDATTAYRCHNCGERPKDAALDRLRATPGADHDLPDGVTIGEPRCEWEFPGEPLRRCEDEPHGPSRYCTTHRAAYWRALEERTILKPTKDRRFPPVAAPPVEDEPTTHPQEGGLSEMPTDEGPRRPRGRPTKAAQATNGAVTTDVLGQIDGEIAKRIARKAVLDGEIQALERAKAVLSRDGE